MNGYVRGLRVVQKMDGAGGNPNTLLIMEGKAADTYVPTISSRRLQESTQHMQLTERLWGVIMSVLRAWIAPYSVLASLSIESEHPDVDYKRIRANESFFPETPTLENPKRHVVNLGMFDDEDLEIIAAAIHVYLKGKGL